MLKLSIIIPVYNVEQYIGKCLESCLNQDLPKDKYEIIVVNDGTPDNSMKRVQEVQEVQIAQEGETNIRIINRENGGLSATRNTGLAEVQGEYVWFVDSDDWIEPNVLKNLTERAYSDNLDVLCFNLQLVFPDDRKEKYNVRYEEGGRVYSGPEFICKVSMPPAAWVALYRKEFLQKWALKFYEGILHEDQEFTPRAYCLAERIAFIDHVIYNYNQREGGIMKSNRNEKRCKDLLTVADSLYKFNNVFLKNRPDASMEMLNKVSFAFTQSLAFYESGFFLLKEYKDKPYYPLYINHNLDKKTRLKYRLANLSLRLYLKLYNLR